EKDLVTFLDHSVAFDPDCRAVTIDCSDASLRMRDMLLQHRDLLPDHRSVAIGHSPYQPDPALGKLEHLQRARIKNQLFNVLAHELFGTYAKVHREGVLR